MPSEISNGPYVCQRESKAEGIFIAYRSKGEAPVLHAHAATVPVVCALGCGILDKTEGRIKAHIHSGAQAALGGAAITQQGAKLVELVGAGDRIGNENFSRHLQIGMASAQKEITEMQQKRDAAQSALTMMIENLQMEATL